MHGPTPSLSSCPAAAAALVLSLAGCGSTGDVAPSASPDSTSATSAPATSAPAGGASPAPAGAARAVPAGKARGLHWFIPDGMRADPDTFDVFTWAQEGRLPHIKALMDRGTWGYSIPTFPSHTPTNFSTLLTGSFPETHGVADGPMRVEGHPLARPSVAGFSSTGRKVPAVWSLLEQAGRKVFLLSVPSSTPPELQLGGMTVRGRWGGWGADFANVIFETDAAERKADLGRNARLFMLAEELTRFVTPAEPAGWTDAPASFSPAYELSLSAYGLTLYGLSVDGTDDGVDNPDRIAFSMDRGAPFASLAEGEWSDWQPATLDWKGTPVQTNFRLHVIRLDGDRFFRVRMQIDALNRFVTDPPEVADALRQDVGPMVDYVDSFPAQLIHYPEDRQTFLDEAGQSLAWHADAVTAAYQRYHPDVVVHCIYTPNQMLTSRWWMGAVDPNSARYDDYSEEEHAARWQEVRDMYLALDEVIGRAMAEAGDDALIVLSADHGAAPQDQSVRLNNVFAEKGWLVSKTDPATGAQVVDWEHSKVVFLKMYSIYVDPEGLGGDWHRASGPAYDALRDEVIATLSDLRDDAGQAPVASVRRWEDASSLDLPADRVGDLILSNHPGYGWSEDVTADHDVFVVPEVTGYKQSIEPGSTKAIWTPFVIAGPGVAEGVELKEPIHHVDQLPTILTLMGVPVPEHVQGHVVQAALAAPAQ